VRKIFLRACVTAISLLACGVVFQGCNDRASTTQHHGKRDVSEADEFERGPHNGRLLVDGSFALEMTIFEQGTPPQLRVYAYKNKAPVSPQGISTTVTLARLGGKREAISLHPMGDFLTSDVTVVEPHSFQVQVEALHDGVTSSWSYDSFEGRTVLPREVAEHSGITVEVPASRTIAVTRRIRGKILPSEHRIAHIIPRFSGIVREGRKHIGDKVEKGEVLAIIESNQSLQPFEVRSQISGTVINGHLIVGEFVPDNQWVYIVADLSEVWADFFVPLRDRMGIVSGQKVRISSPAGEAVTEGTISYLAPYADEKSQAQLVRAVIPNTKNEFLPGMFITGDVVLEEIVAPIAVREQAIQRFREWDVVFVRHGDTYEVRPVTVGRSDSGWVELTQGLSSSDEYVVENSFLIKADILKSGASHDH
jgi:cobalt-zinc-cadmium efflux system membrane fusion protein